MSQNKNLIYLVGHNSFFDKIIEKKRYEIVDIINNVISDYDIFDALDIGTTKDDNNKSSNIIIKNLNNIKIYKSISDQKIESKFFSKSIQKSITENFSSEEVEYFKSDLVISSAVIEHVGSYNNQIKMIENICKLSKKLIIFTTPSRAYPIDFHTKIPFLHWLPKNIHRSLLNIIGMSFFSKEENLNLLSRKDIHNLMKKLNIDYEIINLRLFGLTSNFIVIGKV